MFRSTFDSLQSSILLQAFCNVSITQIFYKRRSSMVCFIIITLRLYRGSAIEYILHLCYIVCLEFIVSRIFHTYGDVNIAGEGLHILINARHSWPLSSEGFLKCHTNCDTGLPFIMVIYENP